MPASDGMAPKSSNALAPQTITLSPDVIAQTTRILHWFSQPDEQGHLSNLVSYQSGDRNAAAKRLLLDTAMLLGSEPSQTVEEIKQRVDDMVELYLHWRATAESVGWGADHVGHDSKVDEAEGSLTIRETILSFCYYYYDMDTIMHGDPKIERSATSEKRPNLVMEKHPSIGVSNLVSFRPRRLRSSTRTVAQQKIFKAGKLSSEESSDSKADAHGTIDELTRGKRPDGMSVRKYWSLPPSSSGPESQAHASQTSHDKASHGQPSFQEVSVEEFRDLLLPAQPAILPKARKSPGEPSKYQLSPHQQIPKEPKPASPSNEALLLRSNTIAKARTPNLELRPTGSKTKSKTNSPASASSNESLLLRPNTNVKTQKQNIELHPTISKMNSPASVSLARKDQSTDATDHRAHFASAHAVRANPGGTLHIPSFYAPSNPPGISLDFYPGTASFGPPQAFGDAHISPQSTSHQYGAAHTRSTLQIPESHADENLSGGLLAFSDSSRDLLDQRALVQPPVRHHYGESRPPVAAVGDKMAVSPQAGNIPVLRQSPMIFPPSRSIFQLPRGPSVLITPKPSSSRVAPDSAPMKRGRERADSAANSDSDTPPLHKKSRTGSTPKRNLDEKLGEMRGLRSERWAETQQRIEGIHTTFDDERKEERRNSRYETRMLVETGRKLAEESNQAAESLRKANAKLHQHLVVIAANAHERLDAHADLFPTGNPQREQGSVQPMGMLHNNVGGIYHQEELIRRQGEMLRRMEEAIGRQDEKIEKMVQKWGKKK